MTSTAAAAVDVHQHRHGFSGPRLGWDSQTDAVKSWSWAASKAA
ncbi:hypothetical protein ACFSNO_31715 [Streptomyces cirratus]